MTLALLFLLLVVASARLTRLVTYDTITARVRTGLLRHGRRQPMKTVAAVSDCPWCMGVYCSAALVAAVWLVGYDLPLPLLWPWAVAGGQMLVNGLDLRLDTH